MRTNRARARKGQSRRIYIHKYEERNGTAGQKAESNRLLVQILYRKHAIMQVEWNSITEKLLCFDAVPQETYYIGEA